MIEDFLWDERTGLGVPAAVSGSAAPFHPLTILASLLPAGLREPVVVAAAAVLAGVLVATWCGRNGAGRVARLAAASVIGGVAVAQPQAALLSAGLASVVLVADWFGTTSGRLRWLILVAAIVLAFLAVRADGVPAVAALVVICALQRHTMGAGVIAAGVLGALLAAPWILPLFAIHPAELPAVMQERTDWVLILAAAIPLFMAVRPPTSIGFTAWRINAAAAGVLLLTGIFAESAGTTALSAIGLAALIASRSGGVSLGVAIMTLAATGAAVVAARPDPCAVRSARLEDRLIRILDSSHSSLDCTSSRIERLLGRARDRGRWDVHSPAIDVAGLDIVDGAANRDSLPRYHLAARFRVAHPSLASLEPISREVALVDHVPAKIAGMSSPSFNPPPGSETTGAGGRVTVEKSSPGAVRLRIRSEGWNLLVTTEPAWSGWRARWNSERIPPVVVNEAFAGSFVPAGEGVLELRYRPDEFDTGLRIAAVGLLLLGFTVWKPWWKAVPAIAWPRLLPARLPAAIRASPTLLAWSATLLLGAYLALLLANFAAIAGGADSSGYLNQARLWQRGTLHVPIEHAREFGLPQQFAHVFVPLGFVFANEPLTMAPSYPPGLPLMIAGTRAVAGDWIAMRIVAFLTAAGIPLMYVLCRAFGVGRGRAAAGAAALAVFPTYVFMGIQPMTDSVAALLAIATMLSAMRADRGGWWAALAGALLGVGVLVRPTQLLLGPALLLALRMRPSRLVAFGLGGVPFAIVQGMISLHLYGSALASGYGGVGSLLTTGGAVGRFEHYVYWMAVLATPLVFPGGMAAWFSRSVDRWTRAILAAWFVPFFVFYVFYPPHETWWYTRFLLPALPPLIVGMLLAAGTLSRRASARLRVLGAAAPALVIVAGIAHTARLDVLAFARYDAIYPVAVRGAERHLPQDAMLVTMQMSGAARYYAGRRIVRWDVMEPEVYREIVRAAGSRPWYALLVSFEIQEAQRRVPGQWREVARFQDVVLFRIEPPRL